MTSGAEAVVEALRAHGVDTVFGIPGVHSLPIYDALDRDGFIRHVLARHEQGAGFMAEGYARTTGRVGVALVTSGPAVTNIATPAASAYTDSVPLLVIATDLATKDRCQRAGVLHELKDQQGLASSVVGWQRTVTHADQIYGAVRDAMHHLERERPRGAILCIPHDLLQHEARTEWAATDPVSAPDAQELVERAADLLAAASRPLIIAGAGLRRGGKVAALTSLAQMLSAPILLGPKSRDLIDDDHPYALWGRLFTVPDEVRQLIDSCDATVVLGSKLAAERTHDGQLELPHPVIQVDIDGDEIARLAVADVAIVGDGHEIVDSLIEALRSREQAVRTDPRDEVRRAREAVMAGTAAWVGDERVAWLQAVRDALPDDAVLVSDMTMVGYASADLFDVRVGGRLMHPFELCSIGCGLPTAIGAKVAAGSRAVLGIGGDGGSLLNIGELATAVQEGIPVVYVVFNDARYTAVATPQERTYGRRVATDLVSPDFAALAVAFGANGVVADDHAGLQKAVVAALTDVRPTVIDVPLGRRG